MTVCGQAAGADIGPFSPMQQAQAAWANGSRECVPADELRDLRARSRPDRGGVIE
jgi:hypothetical protein